VFLELLPQVSVTSQNKGRQITGIITIVIVVYIRLERKLSN